MAIKGLKALDAFLQQLPLKIERNILRGALRQGMNVIKADAQFHLDANGNVKTGLLRLGLKVSTVVKGGKAIAVLKVTGKHGYVAKWIEFGTVAHVIRGKNGKMLAFAGGLHRSVNHPGTRPEPFMRPALDRRPSAVLIAVGEAIKKRLTKEGLDARDVEIEEA